jgi:diguanylate cyclase (GGDEF)-like protein/PAS domain S-box-containing protein
LELCRELEHVRTSEAKFSGILGIAYEAIISMDEAQRIVIFNKGAEQIFGYFHDEVVGQSLDILLPERSRIPHRGHIVEFSGSAVTARHMGERQEIYGRRKNGEEFPAEASISKLEVGGRRIFTVVLRDITERKQAQEALRKRTERVIRHQAALLQLAKMDNSNLQAALKSITEMDSRTLGVERVSVWCFNEDRSEIICKDLYKMSETLHEKGLRLQAKQYPNYFQALEENRTITAHDACTDPRTEEFAEGYLKLLGITSMMDVPIRLHGEVVGVICHEHTGPRREWTLEQQDFGASIADMVSLALEASERKRAEESLAEQAIRDPLTNLYNRRYFDHRIQEEIARADRNGQILAILLCDLDHFKTINDTHGHHVGDGVLKEVAQEIQEATRGTDLVFRWGGDEMIVVLTEANREGILIVAERIRRGVRHAGDKLGVEMDMSIGAALYPEHGHTVDELIHLADRALYIAKKGGDKTHIGEEEYHLDERTIKVVFQSVVDVGANQVIGYEALSRDAHGKLSILELFKKYNAIGQLNELKCLCFKSQMKVAQELGLRRVFINVDFNVLSQLELVPSPPGIEVILEISELEALHDVENHLSIARMWRAVGYRFAIDDFGAGFISLPFIAQLVPEYIKLDRSTMLQAVGSEKFREFSKDLVQALRNYSTEGIIAEGIETEKELDVVKGMGITIVQGYLFGKPKELKKHNKGGDFLLDRISPQSG